METLVEQRTNSRTNLSWPVSVWVPQANRFFNGRSSNISCSGVLVNVPATMPVREGAVLEMNFPRTEALAKEKGSYSRIRCGRVVRVDRSSMLLDSKIGLAIHFE